MKHIQTATDTQFRALLTKAEDFEKDKEKTTMLATRWYNEQLTIDQIKKKAKEEGYDMVILEKMEITMEVYSLDGE